MRSVRAFGPAPWAAALAVGTAAASVGHAPVPLRATLVVLFVLIGPGAGLVPLLGLRDPLGELALAIGTSLAVDVAVALGIVYAGTWRPAVGLAILVVLTVGGACAQIVQTRGSARR
jgi:hypothetical protein